MPTRREVTGYRDLSFSQWIRTHLPDSYCGYLVSDLDFILYNRNRKRLMLIEVKSHGAEQRPWQRDLFEMMDRVFSTSAAAHGINYRGYKLIQLSNSTPEDGSVVFDGRAISQDELISELSMGADVENRR